MATRFVILLSVIGIAWCQMHTGCPIDFIHHGNACYHIFARPTMSWWDAMKFCSIYGEEASLATIETASEQLFLEAQLKTNYPNSGLDFWLGANDLVNEGMWEWVKQNQYVKGYTRWAPGEPSNASSEDCLALFDGLQYQWNDAPCHLAEGFICEVPCPDFHGRIVMKIFLRPFTLYYYICREVVSRLWNKDSTMYQ